MNSGKWDTAFSNQATNQRQGVLRDCWTTPLRGVRLLRILPAPPASLDFCQPNAASKLETRGGVPLSLLLPRHRKKMATVTESCTGRLDFRTSAGGALGARITILDTE